MRLFVYTLVFLPKAGESGQASCPVGAFALWACHATGARSGRGVCVPQNLYEEALLSSAIVFGDEVFGG